MRITIIIPDELLPSYEQFITKFFPLPQEFDATNGHIKPPRPMWTVREYIEAQMDALAQRVGREFPTAAVAAELAQIEALNASIKGRLKTGRDVEPPPEEEENEPGNGNPKP